MDATDLLAGVRLLPVVTVDGAELGARLGRCLEDAGFTAVEVTLRTEHALDALAAMVQACPKLLVGAGSVRRAEQFGAVRDAGAAFAVSPGATEALLDAANLPYVPGAATASECLRLLERGYRLQKFFPAEANGGIAALRALAAPLPEVRFCPTGGVDQHNAADYLALGAVTCVGGSWFAPADLISAGRFDEIALRAQAARMVTG
jgi:2-dehydro-3-deoxyphosphogluconate aldolase/(4S)-4-hydroxy-2-oxoglutarate aldolase